MSNHKDLAAEAEAFLADNPQVTHLDPFIIDLCGTAVGKRYPAAQIAGVYAKGTSLCAATYLLDVTGTSADALGHGFSDGDPDVEAWPVPGTLKPVPWSGGNGAQCLLTLKDVGGKTPLWFEPRVILQRVAKKFAKLGLTPVVAAELEFHLIDNERAPDGAPQMPRNPRTGARMNTGNLFRYDDLEDFAPVLDAIAKACSMQDIPASTALSEYGTGQFEINLDHVADAVMAADHAALLRRAVMFAARDAGFDATFASKPYPGLASSGLHIHLSFTDPQGRNIFDPERGVGDRNLAAVAAGFQAAMAQSLGIFAPNINAMRRFEPDQFVPVTGDWGDNNRSVAFRVPQSDGANRRIEHRIAGAEANPYLAIAAVLAAAHYGLTKELEPTPKAAGNAGAEIDETLPLTPWAAFDAVEDAKILKDYFGKKYLKAYAEVKRAEFTEFLSAMSAREYAWYL